jgi:hypothetical protein
VSEESASGRYLLLMVPVECTEQTDRHRKAGLADIVIPDRSGALRLGPFEVVPDAAPHLF